MNHRRYTYLVGEDILLLKRRYTSFLKETHRSFIRSGMGALLLWLLLLTACVGEELQKPLLGEGEGYLILQIGAISAEVTSSTLTKATVPNAPTEEELMINIKQSDGSSVDGFPMLYANLPDLLVLKAGVTYTVEAYHGKDGEIELSPYFYDSKEITIDPLTASEVSLTPSLANAMLVPVVDETLKKHYSEWTLSVKAGSSQTQNLASNSMVRYLYVQKGLPIEITFSGTNLIKGSTSKTEKVTDAAQPRTQYTIQCNPENLPSFTLATTATAEHTYIGDDYLTGTAVKLNVASLTGTPAALISGWEATLKNADGTTVRTYTANSAPTVGSNPTMNVEGDWPYLPQGNYTLSTKLILKTNETVNGANIPVTVFAPKFSVTASAYTSYNKYTSEDIDGANACDGSKIYEMRAVPSISETLLTNTNYNNIKDSTLTLDGNSVNPGDTTQSWGAHTLKATYTFDGVTQSGSETYHVTGLPYSKSFYNNDLTGWDSNNTELYLNNKDHFSFKPVDAWILSPKFYIPKDIVKVTVTMPVYAYHTVFYRNYKPTLYVSASNTAQKVGIIKSIDSSASTNVNYTNISTPSPISLSTDVYRISIYVYGTTEGADICRLIMPSCTIKY